MRRIGGEAGRPAVRLPKACAVALLVVVTVAMAGCGDGEPSDVVGDGPPKAATSDRGTASDAAAVNGDSQNEPRQSTDGTITRSNGEVVRDWGSKRERQKAVAILVGLQRDFRAGRMATACKNVTDFGLQQFQPGRTGIDTPCPAKLRAFAAELGQREPQRLRLLWVRAYPTTIASVWVRDERGKPVRVPFYGWDRKGWKLELGNFKRPEFLNAELVGAAAYLSR